MITVKMDDTAKASPEEEYAATLKGMSKDQLVTEAEKYNAHLTGDEKVAELRKKVLEAYKISALD